MTKMQIYQWAVGKRREFYSWNKNNEKRNITNMKKGQIFFRASENVQEPECIISLALDKGLINNVENIKKKR